MTAEPGCDAVMRAQGWAPVMAPQQGWVGVYPGGPPPPYLSPHGGHLGPPAQTPFLQPYHLQPPQPPRMHLEEALGAPVLASLTSVPAHVLKLKVLSAHKHAESVQASGIGQDCIHLHPI